MKRLTIIAALLLMAMPMMAERVTPETARKVATTFLNNNGAKSAQLTDLSKSAGFQNLYVFTADEGFVVMAADDCVQPILGYSLTGKFVVEGMPENLQWWLRGYDDQIQDIIESGAKASSETSRQWKELASGISTSSKTRAEIGPLTSTKWNQTYPYNYYCPTCNTGGSGGHVYTGCVATAMAQVMKYHNAPAQGIGSHSYTHGTYGLQTANFGETYYDWVNMPDQIYSSSNPTQQQAVAELIYHCGVAVDMNYGSGASGAHSVDIAPALINYFNYSTSTHYVFRPDYETDEEWIQLMRSELDASRPIIYGGMDHPTNPTSGHSFVCDGYGKDGYDNYYFNFNWGWSGNYNAYFSIDDMKPGSGQPGGGSHNYTYFQDAVIEIKPSNCAVLAPTLLTYTVEGRDISLNWDAVENAVSYSVYRNGALIGTTQSTSYFDETAPFGTNVYYVRSCDVANELSMPSNNVSVTLSFPAPNSLTAQVMEDGIQLLWTAAEGVESYNIYCNDIRIGMQQTETSFVDERIIAGTLSYFVKSVDAFGDESPASNKVSVDVEYKAPIVNDLNLFASDGNASLEWTSPKCYPNQPSATLYYGNGDGNYWYSWSSVYYAHRYLSSNMEQYAGKKVYKVGIKVQYGGAYTVYIYTDTQNDQPNPESLATTNTIVVEDGNTGWREIVLSNPVTLLGNTDLWIVIKQENTGKEYPTPSFDLGTYDANACYGGMDSPTNISPADSQYSVSWFIKAYLTDGTYTYNLYDNGVSIANDITATSYTVANPATNSIHQYTVKTNYYGGESAASNVAGLALGTTTINHDFSLNANDKMTVAENSSLTVTGTLSNANPENLILENGAQIVHNSEGVQATVKKTITPYTANDNGWNFIASPVTENLTPSTDNGLIANEYDLYYYDEPEHHWRNYRKSTFDLAYKQGYLYANNTETTLQFEGTLVASNAAVPVTGLSHSAKILNGFNLVGNPFACNAFVNQDFFGVNGNSVAKLAPTDRAITPCEGIFVKADSDAYTVTFTRANGAKANGNGKCLDLVVTQGKTTLDRARVRLGEGTNMEKFTLDGNESAQLSLWQDGQDYAVAYADGQSELPLNFKAPENGTYSIGIETNSLELDYMHLIDNMTGADIDLLTMPSYTFETKTTDYASRFRLVFAPISENANGCDGNFAFISNGEIIIIGATNNATMQIMDMTGRVIRNCTDGMHTVSTRGMTTGVYVLRLIDGENVKTQKIVIE